MYFTQKCMAILIIIPLSTYTMEECDKQDWSQLTFGTTKNEETGEKSYVGVYPVKASNGLVRVKPYCCFGAPNFSSNDLHITVSRHSKQQIVVAAVLAKEVVQAKDASEKYPASREGGSWMPWLDGCFYHPKDVNVDNPRAIVRGSNRFVIEIKEPGHYHITLPDDVDAEIKTKKGSIDYKSIVPTMVYLKGATAIVSAEGHYKVLEGESRYYYSGYPFNPKSPETRLVAKAGQITVTH